MAEEIQPSERSDSGAPPTGQPVTLEEALFVATAFQRDGRLDEADEIYRKLMAFAPDRRRGNASRRRARLYRGTRPPCNRGGTVYRGRGRHRSRIPDPGARTVYAYGELCDPSA